MKKLLLLGFAVFCSNAQVVDDEARAQIATTAAAVAPYSPTPVAVTSGRTAIVTGVAGQVVVPTRTVLLTDEERQRIEMEQINNELAQFYAVHAHQTGSISYRDWLDFSNGLVARHPEMLELRCDRGSGSGRTYIQFRNPHDLFYSSAIANSWCRVYIKPHVTVPITPYR